MKGLCAPAEQGNKDDGIWLEYKEWERLRNIAGTYISTVTRARSRGIVLGIALGFLLSALLHSVAKAEELYVEAWVEEEPVEQCFSPYAEVFKPEFMIENVLVTMFWYDTIEEFREETGETDPDVHAMSLCETKPEKNIAYCDVFMVLPGRVDDDATLSGGHEYFHGHFGAYHE